MGGVVGGGGGGGGTGAEGHVGGVCAGVQGVVVEGDRGVRRGTEEDDGIWVRCQGKGASVESVRRDVREGLRKGGKVVRLHHTVSILIGVARADSKGCKSINMR